MHPESLWARFQNPVTCIIIVSLPRGPSDHLAIRSMLSSTADIPEQPTTPCKSCRISRRPGLGAHSRPSNAYAQWQRGCSFVRYRYGIGVPPPQRLRLRPLSQESPCPSHTGRPQPGARCMINMIGIRGDRELEPPRCRVCPGVGVGDCLRDRASIALEGGGITAMGEMASTLAGISVCGVAKARAGSEASTIARSSTSGLVRSLPNTVARPWWRLRSAALPRVYAP